MPSRSLRHPIPLRSYSSQNPARSSVKPMFPCVAPPQQVPVMEPVGQTARAARTHCSHARRSTFTVAPFVSAATVNSADPDRPVVSTGLPLHRGGGGGGREPGEDGLLAVDGVGGGCARLPSQMESSAAF